MPSLHRRPRLPVCGRAHLRRHGARGGVAQPELPGIVAAERPQRAGLLDRHRVVAAVVGPRGDCRPVVVEADAGRGRQAAAAAQCAVDVVAPGPQREVVADAGAVREARVDLQPAAGRADLLRAAAVEREPEPDLPVVVGAAGGEPVVAGPRSRIRYCDRVVRAAGDVPPDGGRPHARRRGVVLVVGRQTQLAVDVVAPGPERAVCLEREAVERASEIIGPAPAGDLARREAGGLGAQAELPEVVVAPGVQRRRR